MIWTISIPLLFFELWVKRLTFYWQKYLLLVFRKINMKKELDNNIN